MNGTIAVEARLEADGGSEVPRSRGAGNVTPIFPHTTNILSILSSCPCLAPLAPVPCLAPPRSSAWIGGCLYKMRSPYPASIHQPTANIAALVSTWLTYDGQIDSKRIVNTDHATPPISTPTDANAVGRASNCAASAIT